jgi:hypothetical protein
MTERSFSRRQADDELEWIDTDEELEAYLSTIAPYVGWVIIYFNSLEDHIADFIRMAVLRDWIQDERLDVFLAGMLFAGKAQALVDLYGQLISYKDGGKTDEELKELGRLLEECAKRRNEYTHADWIGVRKGGFVRVKSRSDRKGVSHRYRVFELPKLKEDVAFIEQARRTLGDFNDAIHEHLSNDREGLAQE